MRERVEDLEAKLSQIVEALRQVEERVRVLEQSSARPAAPALARPTPAVPPAGSAEASGEAEVDAAVGKLLPLTGRTLLVLAGAFVLRGLTDSGVLPLPVGVGLGLLYAGTWIYMAERAGRGGRLLSSGFHGAAAVAIGFPLLFEAASRFRLLSPLPAAALLLVLTAIPLGIAAVRRLQGLAWVVGLGGTATAIALMAVAGGLLWPAALYLVFLSVAALWLGYVRGWFYLRWPIAFVTDLVVTVVAIAATGAEAAEGPGAAFLVQGALLALYLGSIATRTLLLKRRVVPFEIVQTAAALLVGLGGAVFVAARSGMGRGGFGVLSLGLGLATYAVAFTFLERLRDLRVNFRFYSTVAIAFVLVGTGLVLPPLALSLTWAALGVGCGVLARRQASTTWHVHGAIYAVGSALVAAFGDPSLGNAFAGSAIARPPALASLLVVAALIASAWLTKDLPRETTWKRMPSLALVAALAAMAAGVSIEWLVWLVAGSSEAAAGAVATVRTGVLVATAVGLAWAGTHRPWLEAGWPVYPLLGVTGVKILLEDLPHSRPATLFLTFALYGAGLILVPRLRRRHDLPRSA